MLQVFWWGAVFLLAVPVMVILLATGPILLPEYRYAAAGRPDFLSVGLALAAILPTVYGLTEIAAGGSLLVRSQRSRPARWSAGGSCDGSGRWPIRSSTRDCFASRGSARRWGSTLWPIS